MPLSLYLDDDQVRQFPYNQEGVLPPLKDKPDFLDLNNKGPFLDCCCEKEVLNIDLHKVIPFAQKRAELIAYIFSCSQKNDFPPKFGAKVCLWFKEIFPRMRQNLVPYYNKLNFTNDNVFCEAGFSHYLWKTINEIPRPVFVKATTYEPFAALTQQDRESFKILGFDRCEFELYALLDNFRWSQRYTSAHQKQMACYYAPHSNHPQIGKPTTIHWNRWIRKYEKEVPVDKEFDVLRDLCYNISTLLSDPDLGSYKRDYLQSWILGAAAQIKK